MTTSTADTGQVFEIKEKLAQLEEALLSATPNMAGLLQEIHRTLKSDPDVVTILSDEECSVLVRGLKKQTNTEIAVAATKKPRKATSKMTTSDF